VLGPQVTWMRRREIARCRALAGSAAFVRNCRKSEQSASSLFRTKNSPVAHFLIEHRNSS
jgi:hypothetical protein